MAKNVPLSGIVKKEVEVFERSIISGVIKKIGCFAQRRDQK